MIVVVLCGRDVHGPEPTVNMEWTGRGEGIIAECIYAGAVDLSFL